MLQRSEQTRGELIGVAHILRNIDAQLMTYVRANGVGTADYESQITGVSECLDICERELKRLIGNQFTRDVDIGNPLQLAKVILLMAGEESEK